MRPLCSNDIFKLNYTLNGAKQKHKKYCISRIVHNCRDRRNYVGVSLYGPYQT